MTSNQPPVYAGMNAYESDPILRLVSFTLPAPIKEDLKKLGQWAGHADTLRMARLANSNPPELVTHEANGDRADRIEFHPAWHALMRKGVSGGLHCSIWLDDDAEKGCRNLSRAARFYLSAGVESGHLCPLTMTNAGVAALMTDQKLLQEWLPGIRSSTYDSTTRPSSQKGGLLLGMGMTERQGGSDVNATTTTAEHHSDDVWILNGHKWFMSAPMNDGFLVLARNSDGIGCYLVPRYLPDGSNNGFRFQRLKDKLGNRSNASSEVEFANSIGHPVGEPNRGIATIMEMVTLTRLDCALASAGLMRTCLAEAVHHGRHRSAFGNLLIDQPIMERVLADMTLDSAAATALAFRLASAFDRAAANQAEAAYARLMTPVIKYWVCKLAPSLIYETMECLGGNGYVETGNLARHYREAPLNAIWEGAGNIMCLDVMRVINSNEGFLETVLAELKRDLGGESAEKTVAVIQSAAKMSKSDPGAARILAEQLAYTAAAAELTRIGATETAEAFTETRLGGLWRSTYGMLDNRHDAKAILGRSFQ